MSVQCTSAECDGVVGNEEVFIDDMDPGEWHRYCTSCVASLRGAGYSTRAFHGGDRRVLPQSMDDIAAEIHATALEKGFWKHERFTPLMANPSIDAEKIALMHSELSEALEALRDDNMDLVAEELADTIIRILDYAEARGLSMDRAVAEKMAKNRDRPHLHGRSW